MNKNENEKKIHKFALLTMPLKSVRICVTQKNANDISQIDDISHDLQATNNNDNNTKK